MRFAIAAAMLAVTAGQAQAAFLTSVDWESVGDGLLTQDSATGLQWLDLSQTAGSLFSAVQAKTLIGQDFYGFRIATDLEVRTMFADGGFPIPGTVTLVSTQTLNDFAAFSSMIGDTLVLSGDYSSDYHGTLGLALVSSDASLLANEGLYSFASSTSLRLFPWEGSFPATDSVYWQSREIGVYLVRGTPPTVPEPTSLALAGFAGIGMAVGAWRRRRQERPQAA